MRWRGPWRQSEEGEQLPAYDGTVPGSRCESEWNAELEAIEKSNFHSPPLPCRLFASSAGPRSSPDVRYRETMELSDAVPSQDPDSASAFFPMCLSSWLRSRDVTSAGAHARQDALSPAGRRSFAGPVLEGLSDLTIPNFRIYHSVIGSLVGPDRLQPALGAGQTHARLDLLPFRRRSCMGMQAPHRQDPDGDRLRRELELDSMVPDKKTTGGVQRSRYSRVLVSAGVLQLLLLPSPSSR